MVSYEFWKAYGLHYIRTSEPFSLSQILESITQLARFDPELSKPVLMDLRETNLLRLDSSDIRSHSMTLASEGASFRNNFAAYLVGHSGTYGMVRMFNIWGDLHGRRHEDRTLVTMDLSETADWLVDKLDLETAEVAGFRAALDELGGPQQMTCAVS